MISKAAVAKLVSEAIKLNREQNETKQRLEAVKAQLREYAQHVCTTGDDGKPEKVELTCKDGVATVSFVKDTPKLIKGSAPYVLKESIPEAVWNTLFDLEVVLNTDFEAAFERLPKGQQKLVKEHVEWRANEPRINLPK